MKEETVIKLFETKKKELFDKFDFHRQKSNNFDNNKNRK